MRDLVGLGPKESSTVGPLALPVDSTPKVNETPPVGRVDDEESPAQVASSRLEESSTVGPLALPVDSTPKVNETPPVGRVDDEESPAQVASSRLAYPVKPRRPDGAVYLAKVHLRVWSVLAVSWGLARLRLGRKAASIPRCVPSWRSPITPVSGLHHCISAFQVCPRQNVTLIP
jgi:hypothetical protein